MSTNFRKFSKNAKYCGGNEIKWEFCSDFWNQCLQSSKFKRWNFIVHIVCDTNEKLVFCLYRDILSKRDKNICMFIDVHCLKVYIQCVKLRTILTLYNILSYRKCILILYWLTRKSEQIRLCEISRLYVKLTKFFLKMLQQE